MFDYRISQRAIYIAHQLKIRGNHSDFTGVNQKMLLQQAATFVRSGYPTRQEVKTDLLFLYFRPSDLPTSDLISFPIPLQNVNVPGICYHT